MVKTNRYKKITLAALILSTSAIAEAHVTPGRIDAQLKTNGKHCFPYTNINYVLVYDCFAKAML